MPIKYNLLTDEALELFIGKAECRRACSPRLKRK